MYEGKLNNELLELLEHPERLTFESQLSLSHEIDSRNMTVDKDHLERAIAEKLTKIKNLYFLKDFGFRVTINKDGVLVTRTTKAVITDVFAVVLGLIVFFIGVYGIGSLVSMFVNGANINVFSLAVNLAMSSLVITGFKFFNGIKRLFDFAGFKLSNSNGVITLKKRFDLKLEEIKKNASDLFLDTEEAEMILRLGEHVIFNSNAENIVQRMTIEELVKTLKE